MSISAGNVLTEQVISGSPEETRALARSVVAGLPAGAVLALHGELGSGKTCFVHGVAQALAIARPITSPTFTIINEYRGNRPLYHIDLYRIRTPDEALDLGLEDYLDPDGITVIEWAERAGDLIPAAAVHIRFERLAESTRRAITITRHA